MSKTSLVSGFYKLTPKERLTFVKEFAALTEDECALLQNTGALPIETADHMIENVVGAIPIPIGIGVNFLINKKRLLNPHGNGGTLSGRGSKLRREDGP